MRRSKHLPPVSHHFSVQTKKKNEAGLLSKDSRIQLLHLICCNCLAISFNTASHRPTMFYSTSLDDVAMAGPYQLLYSFALMWLWYNTNNNNDDDYDDDVAMMMGETTFPEFLCQVIHKFDP